MSAEVTGPEMRCRDEVFVAATPEQVYDVLTDLRTYGRWWTLMQAIPVSGPELHEGSRWVFEGSRPGGRASRWTVEVTGMDRPHSIELSYVEGDLLGSAAWEVRPVGAGSVVAYVYRGVRAAHPASAETFRRYGTSLHSVAMQADALAGLARYLAGDEMDEAWHRGVRARVDKAIGELEPLP